MSKSRQGILGLLPAWALLLSIIFVSACSKSEEGSQVSELPPPDNTVEVSEEPIVVSGHITYQDRVYGKNGFTGTVQNKDVRHVPVDLVDYYGNVVDSTLSDAQGNYSVTGAGTGLRLRVLAKSDAGSGISVSVKNFSDSQLSVTKDVDQSVSQSTLDVSISHSNSLAGAFNIVDVYTAAAEFIASLSNLSLPPLNVFWEKGNQMGTYFCPGSGSGYCTRGKGIYVLGGSGTGGDTDEYDDDVLWHEFAHYLENTVGISDSPGGVHYLTDNDLDLRLAWSEAWGEFFPVMIKQWLKATGNNVLSSAPSLPTTYFIDTYGSSVGIALDLADPDTWFCPGGADCFVYSSSEVAIAKVLVKSLQAFNAQALWDVYQYYLPSGNPYPASLETFWDGWLSLNAPDAGQLQQLQAIYNERFVYYQHDGYEADDVFGAAGMQYCMMGECQSELRHLYSNGGGADLDLVAFEAQAGQLYTLQTYDLSNGADTEIRVLDALGNVVTGQDGVLMLNDDRPGTVYCYSTDSPCRLHNDDLMFSSELQFAAPATGTYYLQVKTPNNRSPVAGRYGSYRVAISAQ